MSLYQCNYTQCVNACIYFVIYTLKIVIIIQGRINCCYLCTYIKSLTKVMTDYAKP